MVLARNTNQLMCQILWKIQCPQEWTLQIRSPAREPLSFVEETPKGPYDLVRLSDLFLAKVVLVFLLNLAMPLSRMGGARTDSEFLGKAF